MLDADHRCVAKPLSPDAMQSHRQAKVVSALLDVSHYEKTSKPGRVCAGNLTETMLIP